MRISDLRSPQSKLSVWLRRNPAIVDAVVVLLACGPYLAALIYRAYDFGWWGYPLLLITAAALFMRRRWPLAMLTIVAVTCAFSPLARPGAGFPMIPFAFALYTVASMQPTWRAISGYGIGIVTTALATIPYSLRGLQPPLVSLFDAFALLAVVIGVIVKSRRDQDQRLLELMNERIRHAALTERSRIAAEMHDVVAHALTVIVSLANGAASIRTKQPEKADAAVQQIASIGRDALEDMHQTLDLLRSADVGLDENLHHSGDNLPTLEELVEGFGAAGLAVHLHVQGTAAPEDIALRQAIFRIVQESLTNTLRHARAVSSANVTIVQENGLVKILVEDDGSLRATPHLPGHGLVGIELRARAFGGHASSGPRPDGGWRTEVTLFTRNKGVENV